ncbi:uncharacterized protein LOC111371948 [Olea europaea var. sylvestris]|uniref:uncharacterized protein LOC111371948 n=1 Tax=Olea europaea var. sylvestris TaxID=158386 RepID=UPI000C1D6C99|nr:uncharacterized protein LOC111371948 [Olea europaea var. sylvestris]
MIQAILRGRIKEAQDKDLFSQKIKAEMGTNKSIGFKISADNMLTFEGRLCVLEDESLRNEILEEAHSTPICTKSRRYNDASGSSRYLLVEKHEERNWSVCREMYYLSAGQGRTSKAIRTIESLGYSRMEMGAHSNGLCDGLLERTIQTLEETLRACVLDLGGGWETHLTLVEFAYNNSFQATIGMAPYEALYGRKYISSILWDKKSYADGRRRDPKFQLGDKVFLKVAPMKSVLRFGKKEKLRLRFIGPFKILERIDLSYEEVLMRIFDRKVHQRGNREVLLVKVQWRNHRSNESIWEKEDELKTKYPEFLNNQAVQGGTVNPGPKSIVPCGHMVLDESDLVILARIKEK